MPELPEVEMIARSLDKLLRGRSIIRAELLREKLAPANKPRDFSKSLLNVSINSVGRRGKHLLVDLDNDKTLIVHLRMSGRFSIVKPEIENPKFTHAVFHLDGGDRLVFDDQRHFGMMKLVESNKLHESKELKKLAPEPFSEGFTRQYLRDRLKGSRLGLKSFLLDQTKVCGLGNIYACEAMFAARVDPYIVASSLSPRRAGRLFESIIAVLAEAIESKPDANADPENIEGNYFNGSNGDRWYVYDREGEECVVCGKPIVRIKQGGRSTYYCRRCQKR